MEEADLRLCLICGVVLIPGYSPTRAEVSISSIGAKFMLCVVTSMSSACKKMLY